MRGNSTGIVEHGAVGPNGRKFVAVILAACSGLAGTALAQPGPGGGAVYVERPQVTSVKCVRRCASKARAREGSTVRLAGQALESISYVTFHGTFGRADDTYAKVRPSGPTRLNARVPAGAVSGPVTASASQGGSSRRTRPLSILPPPGPEPNPRLTPVPGPRQAGAPRLETGTSRTKAFYGARRAVTFSFRVSGPPPAALRVELIRARDSSVVQTWAPAPAPGSVQRVVWNGGSAGRFAGPGRYSFRLTAANAGGALARSSHLTDLTRDAFDLYDHTFPVRGRHYFGGAGARFGAGRGGRRHQGHDVLARCGTTMVAARGGKVRFKGYHRAAGNYLVIDGAGTGLDYVYMHLAEPTPFLKSDRVHTGQRIGAVGQTGNARGCHLHFELWGAPGWYSGGGPFDPLPALQAWDSWSS